MINGKTALGLEQKLEAARNHAEGYGRKRGLQATADDYVKGVYAQLYADAPEGPVAERDAWVKRQAKYKDAIVEKQNRYAAWEAARIYMEILKAEVELHKVDTYSERWLDKAHT